MGMKKIPVLKRKGFIEQFETTVKQEIALHEKKVQEADLRLNSFQRFIRTNKELVDDKLKQIERQCLDLEKHFDEKNDIDQQFQVLKSNIKDLEKKNTLLNTTLSNLFDLLNDYVNFDNFKNSQDSVQSQIFVNKKDYEDLFSKAVGEQKQIEKKLAQEVESRILMEKELFSSIDELRSKVESFKEQINKSLYDSDWIKDDRKRQNSIIHYLEKKFEYLNMKVKELEFKEDEKK